MRILIVEDNPVSAKALEIFLRRAEYEISTAKSGVEALAQLRRDDNIDLVITDLVMPGMGGLELIRTMKDKPVWRSIPIIVATGLDGEDTVKEALTLGCQGYVCKPIKADQLRLKIREILEQEKEVLRNPSVVMGELGIDGNSYCEIAQSLAQEATEMIRQLETPAAALKPGFGIAITNLRESALVLGADRLGKTATHFAQQSGGDAGKLYASDIQVLARQLKLLLTALKRATEAQTQRDSSTL